MLNPLRHLSGKLNHLQLPQQPVMSILKLANSLTPTEDSNLESYSP